MPSSADKSISDDTTLSEFLDAGDCDLLVGEVVGAGLSRFDIPMLLLLLRGRVRPPNDCLPLVLVLRLLPTLLVGASSSLLRSDDDLARAKGADSRRLPLLVDPVEEWDPLRRSLVFLLPPSSLSSSSSYVIVGRTAAAPSNCILTSGDMIAALSAGMVDSPLLPVRDGIILEGPGIFD